MASILSNLPEAFAQNFLAMTEERRVAQLALLLSSVDFKVPPSSAPVSLQQQQQQRPKAEPIHPSSSDNSFVKQPAAAHLHLTSHNQKSNLAVRPAPPVQQQQAQPGKPKARKARKVCRGSIVIYTRSC